MLTVHQLARSYDLQTLFQDVTFSLNPGDRVGLIGPNGSGKSTLLRIMAGELPPDSGRITHDPGLRIGYLRQAFALDPELPLGAVLRRAADGGEALEDELAQVALTLGQTPHDTALQQRYDRLLARMAHASPGRLAAIAHALDLDAINPALAVGRLSGGQQTRLALALLLLGDPELLLLDEPTNHLDIAMLEWLEDWLATFPGAALIVSHDRTFLDRTCNRILALDGASQTLSAYTGNYSDYLDQFLAAREKQWAAYKDQVAEIRRMRQAIQAERARADRIEATTTSGQPNLRRKAKRAMKRAMSKESRLDRYVEDEERVDKPARSWQMKFEPATTAPLGRAVFRLEQLAVGYPGHAPLLEDITLDVAAGQRIAITGPNGSGKTTLLNTLAGNLPPLAGRLTTGSSVRIGVLSQDQANIDPALSAVQHLGGLGLEDETAIRNYLHFYLFTGDEALKPAALLSYGQRARLALAQLVAAGCNVLLLDEPINHLDIPSRTQFEQALLHFDGTTLAVVHDRYFIDRFATEVWWVEDRGIMRELRAAA